MVNWKKAQANVLERLTRVEKLIEAEDESGVLELINQQDAFCDAAEQQRAETAEAHGENHCHFCEGYKRGGCSGRLGAIDHAVLHAEWPKAALLVKEYASWVKSIDFPPD